MTRVTVAAVAALGPSAPSFRVRALLPLGSLAEQGVDLRPYPLFTGEQESRFRAAPVSRKLSAVVPARNRLLAEMIRLPKDDTVAFVQRQADILPSLRIERTAATGRRLVYDVDDAIWSDQLKSGGHPLAFLKRSRSKTVWLARRADVVIAGNEMLAEWLSRYSSAVEVIPSLVDVEAAPVRRHDDQAELVLGWIGSPTTARYLRRLVQPLERLARGWPKRKIRLAVMGGQAPEVTGVGVEPLRWSEAGERELLSRMDIGLMPLPDDVWTRGKCAYKALQYMAAGVPVVADDVGVTARVVGHGQGGLVVRGDDQWIEALRELGGQTSLRARMGGAARARVAASYSLAAWQPTLLRCVTGQTGGA